MARPDKAAAVGEIAESFRASNGAVLTEYRGLTVKQLKELRRSLGGSADYAVVKNTLTKIAAKDAGVEGLDEMLVGPSAIAFITGDPVEAAKGLRDFARAHPLLVIKGGVLDGRPVSPDEIKQLADLESREVLLAKLAGAMKASMANAAALFSAPLAQTARLLGALQDKRAQEQPAGPATSAQPAPDAVAPEAATDEVTAEESAPEPTTAEPSTAEPSTAEPTAAESARDATDAPTTEPDAQG